MDTVEHEVLVIVQVCESRRGRRRAQVVGVIDADDERRALLQAADACGPIEFGGDRDEWFASGYVQRVRVRLPILEEPLRTITVEGPRTSSTKRLPRRR